MFSREIIAVNASATMGFNHSFIFAALAASTSGRDELAPDLQRGRITIPVTGPIMACLRRSGHQRSSQRYLIPADAVDGLDFQNPNHLLKYLAEAVVDTYGQLGADLSPEGVSVSPAMRAVLNSAEAQFAALDTVLPAVPKKTRRRTRKVVRRG